MATDNVGVDILAFPFHSVEVGSCRIRFDHSLIQIDLALNRAQVTRCILASTTTQCLFSSFSRILGGLLLPLGLRHHLLLGLLRGSGLDNCIRLYLLIGFISRSDGCFLGLDSKDTLQKWLRATSRRTVHCFVAITVQTGLIGILILATIV